MPKFHTLRDRVIKEVLLFFRSEGRKEILTVLKRAIFRSYDFEIHVDIGENGETKALIQEMTGMIGAYDFEAPGKPGKLCPLQEVADRHV